MTDTMKINETEERKKKTTDAIERCRERDLL